jgi:mono/diheme cytochrome c family protein
MSILKKAVGRRNQGWSGGALVAALLLGACTNQSDLARASLADDGREIAEAQCAQCHAVGSYGDSPHAQAPAFRTILTRYDANVLEEELIAGIRVAHPMPEFQFNPQGTDALIAYLQSIQEPNEPPQ